MGDVAVVGALGSWTWLQSVSSLCIPTSPRPTSSTVSLRIAIRVHRRKRVYFPIPPLALAPSHLLSAYIHPSASVNISSSLPSSSPAPLASTSSLSLSLVCLSGLPPPPMLILPSRIFPAARSIRAAPTLAADPPASSFGGVFSTLVDSSPSLCTTTRHSGSAQRHCAVRFSRFPCSEEEGR